MERPLLYPMDGADLRARPALVACAASDTPPRWRAPAALLAAGPCPAGLRPADGGLRPAGDEPWSDEPFPPDDADAQEEEGPDAVPTSQMPQPVCVPLDENPFAPRRRVWPWALGAAALFLLGLWFFQAMG